MAEEQAAAQSKKYIAHDVVMVITTIAVYVILLFTGSHDRPGIETSDGDGS